MDTTVALEIAERSSALTSVGWISYVFIGAIAGWIAGKAVRGGGSGLGASPDQSRLGKTPSMQIV